jgi:hypothetical protein
MTTNRLGANHFQGSAQLDNQEEILAAEREIQASEEALEESRRRLKAAQAEQKRITVINQRAAALQSDMTNDDFGRLSRKVTVWELLTLFRGEIITTNVGPTVLKVTLADAMAMMRATSEPATIGEIGP